MTIRCFYCCCCSDFLSNQSSSCWAWNVRCWNWSGNSNKQKIMQIIEKMVNPRWKPNHHKTLKEKCAPMWNTARACFLSSIPEVRWNSRNFFCKFSRISTKLKEVTPSYVLTKLLSKISQRKFRIKTCRHGKPQQGRECKMGIFVKWNSSQTNI